MKKEKKMKMKMKKKSNKKHKVNCVIHSKMFLLNVVIAHNPQHPQTALKVKAAVQIQSPLLLVV